MQGICPFGLGTVYILVPVSVLAWQPKRNDLPLTLRAMDNHRIHDLKLSEVMTHQDYALLVGYSIYTSQIPSTSVSSSIAAKEK